MYKVLIMCVYVGLCVCLRSARDVCLKCTHVCLCCVCVCLLVCVVGACVQFGVIIVFSCCVFVF